MKKILLAALFIPLASLLLAITPDKQVYDVLDMEVAKLKGKDSPLFQDKCNDVIKFWQQFMRVYEEYAKGYEVSPAVFSSCGNKLDYAIEDLKKTEETYAGKFKNGALGAVDEAAAVRVALGISVMYRSQKNFEKAWQYLDRARSYARNFKEYEINDYAIIYNEAYRDYINSKYEDALAKLDIYIKADPVFHEAHNLRSSVIGLMKMEEQKKQRDARNSGSVKSRDNRPSPANPEARKLVKEAEAAMNAGELDKASSLVSKALELEPGNNEYMGLQRVIMLKKKHKK